MTSQNFTSKSGSVESLKTRVKCGLISFSSQTRCTVALETPNSRATPGLVWGALATTLGLDWALFAAGALGIVGALTARRWSIDFSTEINLEPDPLANEVPNL